MMPTRESLEELRAHMNAEQAYYRQLSARIRLARYTGAPVPQVHPYPGPRMWDTGEPPAPSPRLPLAPGWAATFLAPRVEGRAPVFAWSRAAPRRRPAGRLRSLAAAFARAMWPVRRRGPVL